MDKLTVEKRREYVEILPIERLQKFEESHLNKIDGNKCHIWNMEILRKCYFDDLAEKMKVNPDMKEDRIAMKAFNEAIVNLSTRLEFMRPILVDCEKKYRNYLIYATRVGVVVVDIGLNFVVLVEAYGHKGSWSFAKSKKEPWKTDEKCAVDECSEELGLEITIDDKNDYIQKRLSFYNKELDRKVTTRMKLYYVFGVSMERKFKATTRKEIQSYAWFRISCLAKSSVKELQGKFKFSWRSAKVIKTFSDEIYQRCERMRKTMGNELTTNHPQYHGLDVVNKKSLIDEEAR